MEDKTLATELLEELKATSKRWFIAFLVMVGLEIATIAGFMWYITLPVETVEEYSVKQDADDRSFNMIGGDYIGGATKDNLSAQDD